MSLTLYHNDLSTCAQKVRLVLAEKAIAWEGRELDLRAGDQRDPSYKALNPRGVVPTLVHGDTVVTESTVIIEYLDDAFPDPALRPADAGKRAAMRWWMKRIDDDLHRMTGVLSYAIAFRQDHLERPDGGKAMLEATKDPQERMIRAALLDQGLDFPGVGKAFAVVDGAIAEAEARLTEASYLAGSYSLADAAWTPYLNRFAHLGLDWLWAERPHLADWWASLQSRASYRTALADVERSEKVAAMNEAGRAGTERIAAWRETLGKEEAL
ncbi:glutathione S-transferase family protein [Parvularcula maris]|uniref:Glutathione S-transferase family protein n=1 Tax=Parvularcula maris TaxID=2965077 RepID=A0A9X2RJI3_9PROT|nr:glutathione S-transferase family protein [Parvularcula maris]MCQ8185866.1 glutathione S-transferase family protein [Parvularcula maris]